MWRSHMARRKTARARVVGEDSRQVTSSEESAEEGSVRVGDGVDGVDGGDGGAGQEEVVMVALGGLGWWR